MELHHRFFEPRAPLLLSQLLSDRKTIHEVFFFHESEDRQLQYLHQLHLSNNLSASEYLPFILPN